MKHRLKPVGNCSKRSYATEVIARVALMKLRHTAVQMTYKCLRCGRWHLSSQNPAREGVRLK